MEKNLTYYLLFIQTMYLLMSYVINLGTSKIYITGYFRNYRLYIFINLYYKCVGGVYKLPIYIVQCT